MLRSPCSPSKAGCQIIISIYASYCISLFCFVFLFFWKRLHERFFRSSPTLSQFPGRSRFIGCNVRQISVSLPLLPRVNALSSENTASLRVYSVRRWVLPFFSLPCPSFFFPPSFRDIEILSAPVAFWSRWVDLVLDRMRVSKRKESKNCLCFIYIFLKDKCLGEVRRTCGFVRVWEEEAKYVCVLSDHHKDISCISRPLSFLLTRIVFLSIPDFFFYI